MNDPTAIPIIAGVLNELDPDEPDPEVVEPVEPVEAVESVGDVPLCCVVCVPAVLDAWLPTIPTYVLSTVCVKGELAQPHRDIGFVPFQVCEKQYELLSAVLPDCDISLQPRQFEMRVITISM